MLPVATSSMEVSGEAVVEAMVVNIIMNNRSAEAILVNCFFMFATCQRTPNLVCEFIFISSQYIVYYDIS